MIISFTSGYYYFFEKLKIMEKNQCKLNCSDRKVPHAIKKKIENFIRGNCTLK